VSQKTRDTEIVFRDLTRANKKLRHQRKNPDAVRRRFTEFVALSQKLTATTSKEFKSLTGHKWEAEEFAGWNNVTKLFRELRNTDVHELPIRIIITQVQEFDGYWVKEDSSGNKTVIPDTYEVRMVFNPEAGLKKGLPNPFGVAPIDQSGAAAEMMPPDDIHFEFDVEGRTPKVEALIEKAGTRNVHSLAASCYAVLSEYYRFYQTQLSAAGIAPTDH
jgi:hypothetical protein